MKKTSVVHALDQIRSAIGNLQNFSGPCIQLDLPAILTADLEHSLLGTHVQTIDVAPAFHLRLGNVLCRGENLVKAEQELPARPSLRRRLNPGRVLLQLQDNARHKDNTGGNQNED